MSFRGRQHRSRGQSIVEFALILPITREGPSVVAACARVLGDRHEAEDVAQEAFVIAYRSLATWRAECPVGAWIARIGSSMAVMEELEHLVRRRAEADEVGRGVRGGREPPDCDDRADKPAASDPYSTSP